MNTTVNLNLKKPEGTDSVNIADINSNMDILDQAVVNKVDKVSGKQLSTEDFTTIEKNKLAGIAENSNNYAHPATHSASIITEDSTHRFVTDAEKLDWNGKASQESLDEVSVGLANIAKYPTATGTADAITVVQSGFSLGDGKIAKFKASVNNTGTVTIDVESTGVKSLKAVGGTDLVAGDIEQGYYYEAVYSSGEGFFILRPRGAKLGGIISAIEGKGGTVSAPGKAEDVITAINGVASWDSDLVASNILTSKNIFGVTGTVKIASGSGVGDSYGNLTVNTLTFTPTNILAYVIYSIGSGEYITFRLAYVANLNSYINSTSNNLNKVAQFIQTDGSGVGTIFINWSTNSSGFTLTGTGTFGGQTIHWLAAS